MKNLEISTAKTAELLAFYNEHAAKPVAKFADRKTAEKRVAALLATIEPVASETAAPEATEAPQEVAQDKCPRCGGTDLYSGHGKPLGGGMVMIVDEEFITGCHACGHEVDSRVADKPVNEARSEGVKKSWADEAVKAARSSRHAVEVGGVRYRSVREAFKALGLPDSKHIKFRGELKKAGEGVFEGHDFQLVQA